MSHPKESKPSRPYANFEDFRQRRFYFNTPNEGVPWLCATCEGRGWIFDPNDPPCPIEGNKCRTRIKCPACKGSKAGTREEYVATYRNIIAQWKERLRTWQSDFNIWKQIRLTPEQVRVLRKFGLPT